MKVVKGGVLSWVERTLFASGIVLGLWCVVVLLEARFMSSLAVAVGVTKAEPAPAPGSLIARLDAPSLHISASVLEGTDDGTLRRGVGHIEDTALPGEVGNVGLAGHRDTVFRPLRRAAIGDQLTLTTSDHVFRYRISRTSIVNPDEVSVLDPTAKPTLTLVTCYPFRYIGHAPRRFIVKAELTGEEARAAR